jgi:hypothetical protein
MPIDISRERLITPVAVTRLRPPGRNGRPMSISTVYRHFFRGVRGVRLEFIRYGGQLYTSCEAVQRFVDALTAPSARPAAAASRDDERTERELSKLGL